MKKQYEKLMRRCIKLAEKSKGRVSPNPLVGCIICDDDFNIVSEGSHEYYGGNHAERNAILKSKYDLKGKTLIVNLEPCSHFGKTPPCADLIIEKGIKRVVVGMIDPNPIVSGNGIKKLQDAGIEVITGILENECRELNKIFIKNQLDKKPYIIIKTATTLDGKIAGRTRKQEQITDETSLKEVHKLRNQYDAILTSSSTVKSDNPKLTCRIKNGRNPIRVILDTNLSTSPKSNVYNNDGTKIYLITSHNTEESKIKKYPPHIEILKCHTKDNLINIKQAIKLLYENGIRSIMVEAGGKINKSFLQENLMDELVQFIAPKIMGDTTAISFVDGFNRDCISKCNNLKAVSTKLLNNDIMVICKHI